MSSTYLDSLRSALHELMRNDERVVVIGEDIVDPYGGAFKVTQGLSTAFEGRVISTPISEAAIVGVGAGLAIRGFLPVVEIMFGDFVTLAADQLINTAAKFPLMYRGKVTVPLVVRTPMGGRRGYGPTHSQSLEKLFFGVPGVSVVSPSLAHNPGALLSNAVRSIDHPVLFVEAKNLYPRVLELGGSGLRRREVEDGSPFPTVTLDNFEHGEPDAVLISYGGSSELVINVLHALVAEEIRLRGVFPSLLNQRWSVDFIRSEIPLGVPVLIAEEGTESFNWGSEVACWVYESSKANRARRIVRLAARADIIPAAKSLESQYLPSDETLTKAILEVISE